MNVTVPGSGATMGVPVGAAMLTGRLYLQALWMAGRATESIPFADTWFRGTDSYLAGLPALSVPCGLVDAKPVGLQIIGNYFDEARMLNAAHRYQLATGWHRLAPPALTEAAA